MKKFLFSSLFFISAAAYAQKYHFDYSVSYHLQTLQNTKPKTSNIYKRLIDANNPYVMMILEKNSSRIFDYEKSKIHYFKNKKGGKLVYLESKKINFIAEFEMNYLEVEELSPLNYGIKSFKKKGNKNPNFYLIVTLKKSKDDLFTALPLDFNAKLKVKLFSALKEKLDNSTHYSISKAEIYYDKNTVFVENILEIKPIDFTLSVEV